MIYMSSELEVVKQLIAALAAIGRADFDIEVSLIDASGDNAGRVYFDPRLDQYVWEPSNV